MDNYLLCFVILMAICIILYIILDAFDFINTYKIKKPKTKIDST